jgi:hypothetical protein
MDIPAFLQRSMPKINKKAYSKKKKDSIAVRLISGKGISTNKKPKKLTF